MAERNVAVKLSARVDAYVAAMRAASASTLGFSRATERNLKNVGGQMQSLGRNMTTFVSVPIAAAGAFAVASAVKWESAWAGVTKTVDGTAEQLASLEQGLRDMSKELPATHGEIAAVAEAAGALGVATEDIEFFTRTMIDLGETTNLTSDGAATAIAKLMNVMGTAGDDVDNLGSALVHLGNNGASTEAEILDMAQRISGAAAVVGASEADVLGLANGLASLGIEAELGGTAISRVMSEIDKNVSVGGERLELFAETAGMSASQFAAAWQADPVTALVAFIDGLGRLDASGGSVDLLFKELGLSGTRVGDVLKRLMSSGDLLTESLQMSGEAWRDNTALADEAAKRYETSAAKFEMVRNKIVDLFIDLGNIMLPAVEKIVDVIGVLAEKFQDLPAPVQMAVGGFLALVAAAGPMIFIAGSLVKNLTQIRSAMTLMGPAAGKASAALGAIGLAATAGFIGYQIFTAEQRKTDEVTRNVSGALLGNMAALLATGDAAGFAAGEIDAVAIAQEALALALGDGFEGLTNAFATFNVSGEDMITILAQMDQAPVMALDNLARSFGFTAEQADRLAQTNIGTSFGASTEALAAQIQAPIEQVEAFREALFKLQGAADNVDMNAIAQQFLNSQVTAHGFEDSLVGAAEAQAGQTRQTGDAMAVLYAWTQLMAGADDETQNAILTSGEYQSALAELPPELQALMDGADGAAGAVGELDKVAASSIDTMSDRMDYLSDLAHIFDEYGNALEETLGPARDWIRAHDDFSGALLGFDEQIEKASAGLDYNTEAGLANREAIFDLADGVIALTEANFASGKGQDETNREYQAARTALLDAAEAAGLNREDVEKLISAYGLVPELVTTTVDLANDALMKWRIDRYIEKLDEVDPEIATAIEVAIDNEDWELANSLLRSIPGVIPVNVTVSSNIWSVVAAFDSIRGRSTLGSGWGGSGSAGGRFVRGGSNFVTSTGELPGARGDEVILPLGDPGRMDALLGMSEVGPRVAAALGRMAPYSAPFTSLHSAAPRSSTSATTMHVTVNMPPGSDGDDVVRALKSYERRAGPIPVRVRAVG